MKTPKLSTSERRKEAEKLIRSIREDEEIGSPETIAFYMLNNYQRSLLYQHVYRGIKTQEVANSLDVSRAKANRDIKHALLHYHGMYVKVNKALSYHMTFERMEES